MKSTSPLARWRPEIPARFCQLGRKYPEFKQAYEALGNVARQTGPLDVETRVLVKLALVKLALGVGTRRERITRSHTRCALDTGCTDEVIRDVLLLATTTLGFPSMMATMKWVEDLLSSK